MIVKHVPMKVVKKSSFSALVSYIVDEKNTQERVGEISVTNCYQLEAPDAVLEIEATQAQNTRALSDKTYHVIISFRGGEYPEPSVLKTIESRICAGLGYGEHQRISVAHHDTDNIHIHVAISELLPP